MSQRFVDRISHKLTVESFANVDFQVASGATTIETLDVYFGRIVLIYLR